MHRTRSLAVVLGAAGLVAATVAPTAPATAAPAAASSCAAYQVISARGSGDLEGVPESEKYSLLENNYGMGQIGYTVWQNLSKLATAAHQKVSRYGVHYPAVDVGKTFGGIGTGAMEALHVGIAFNSSVDQGASDIQHQIETVHRTCGSTRFVVIGYSQGAQAAGDALQRMPSKDRALVAASALFGNTEFNADDTTAARSYYNPNRYGFNGVRGTWSHIVGTPVLDYCHDGDTFCGLTRKVGVLGATVYVRDVAHIAEVALARHEGYFQEHENYVPQGDAADAATELADRLGLKAPTTAAPGAPSDTVFVIDSTGSMSDEIDDVKSNVQAIATALASTSSSYRFALVDFKDDADDDSDYQSRVDVPFTSDTAAFSTGVADLTADGGGDTPESQYSGIMTALNLPWRDGVKKNVIVITDAPGKDPEPTTGYTLAQVTAKAFAIDPAQVYGLDVSGGASDTSAFLTDISRATGGTVTDSDGSATFIDALKATITTAGAAPVVRLTADTGVTATVSTTLGASTDADPSDPIVGYDWNFGTGTAPGSYDRSTTGPTTAVTYATPGTYSAAVRVRTRSGLAGLATQTVRVVARASARPGAPSRLTAVGGDRSVTLKWKRGTGPAADYYLIRNAKHEVVAAFAPVHPSSTQTWTVPGLRNGTKARFSVSAVNSAGISGKAASASAIPKRPRNAPAVATAKSAARGGLLRVTGSRFKKGDRADVWIDGVPANIAHATIGRSGRFAVELRVPKTAKSGTRTVVVSTAHGSATTRVTVKTHR